MAARVALQNAIQNAYRDVEVDIALDQQSLAQRNEERLGSKNGLLHFRYFVI